VELHVLKSDFITTATGPEGWPKHALPEVAFVGRSNVGKSSLINALCRRRKLVRVSNTPGRTRTLNFFEVDVQAGRKLHRQVLCDLPGYGFAKVSKGERNSWKAIIDGYLTGRPELRGVVLLIDGEIGPTEQDLETLGWLGSTGRPVLVVATKMDRLNKAKRIPALRAHAVKLAVPETMVIGVSATEPFGVDEIWWRLFELEQPEAVS
jgi:GTP-binding protein